MIAVHRNTTNRKRPPQRNTRRGWSDKKAVFEQIRTLRMASVDPARPSGRCSMLVLGLAHAGPTLGADFDSFDAFAAADKRMFC